MSDSFERRLRAAEAELTAAGQSKASMAPFGYQTLRRFGMKPPPPHYCSFAFNASYQAVMFSSLFGLLMWLFVWAPNTSATQALVRSATGGLIFGCLMGMWFKFLSYKHRLTPWPDL